MRVPATDLSTSQFRKETVRSYSPFYIYRCRYIFAHNLLRSTLQPRSHSSSSDGTFHGGCSDLRTASGNAHGASDDEFPPKLNSWSTDSRMTICLPLTKRDACEPWVMVVAWLCSAAVVVFGTFAGGGCIATSTTNCFRAN